MGEGTNASHDRNTTGQIAGAENLIRLTPEAEAALLEAHDILRQANAIHADIDGTLWFSGIPLEELDSDMAAQVYLFDQAANGDTEAQQMYTEQYGDEPPSEELRTLAKKREAEFKEEGLHPIERRIFEHLAEFALKGGTVSLITGKEANVYPIAQYLRTLVNRKAKELGLTDTFEDGRLKAADGNPVVLTLSTGNGGLSLDILGTPKELADKLEHASAGFGERYFYKQEIPLSFYEGVGNPETAQLLRDSTLPTRFDEIKLATPQYFGYEKNFPVQKPTENATRDQIDSYISQTRSLIGDFALISPSGTKINLVLSAEQISANETLQKRWEKKTGVRIVNQKTMLQAFDALSKDWNINSFEAYAMDRTGVGKTYIDIAHPDVEKGASVQHVESYVRALYEHYGQQPPRFVRLSIGDKPDGNDATLLVGKPGALTNKNMESKTVIHGNVPVTAFEGQRQGWPVPIDLLKLNAELPPMEPEEEEQTTDHMVRSLSVTEALRNSISTRANSDQAA